MGNDPKPSANTSQPKDGSVSAVETTLVHELETLWISAVAALGIEPEASRPVFDHLVEMYSENDRAYHNLSHVQAMLKQVVEHASELQNYHQVVLAVFFHDAIYDSRAKDNEEQSAALIKELLEPFGLQTEDSEAISWLVLSTKKHQPILSGIDNQIFLDTDLAILGTAPEAYVRYCGTIRQEYSWVSEADYTVGRKAVLNGFLQRERIYFSDSVRDALETQARENITAEIRALDRSRV